MAALPVYAGLIYGQDLLVPEYNFYTDHPDDPPASSAIVTLLILLAHFLPAPIGSWWLLRSLNIIGR